MIFDSRYRARGIEATEKKRNYRKSNLTVATSPVTDSFGDYELVPTITSTASADLHPRWTSNLRHDLDQIYVVNGKKVNPLPVSAPAQGEGSYGTSQKKRRGLVKGVSL